MNNLVLNAKIASIRDKQLLEHKRMNEIFNQKEKKLIENVYQKKYFLNQILKNQY